MPTTNTYLTIGMVTRIATRVLENQLVFAKQVVRQYDDYFAKKGAKIGSTLNIRKPPRYMGRTGTALSPENATETAVPLVLGQPIGVDLQFGQVDLTLSVDDFTERFIKPAVAIVANKIDYDGLQLVNSVYNEVGTPGTVPTSLLTYLSGRQRQNEEATPDDNERCFVLSPAQEAVLVNALTGLFNPQTAISGQFEKGKMGHAIGYDWYMSQNTATHLVGAATVMPTVSGAGQTGNSLLVTGGTPASEAGFLNVGDVFTIAGVYAVNPLNGQSTGALRQFVVTAPVNSPASGNFTIPISPAITPATALTQGFAGGFSTVNASPASGAALTLQGAAGTSSSRGLAFHKEAFALGSADLYLPTAGVEASRVADDELGLSITMARQYNIQTMVESTRLDIIYGWTTIYPEFACRIAS